MDLKRFSRQIIIENFGLEGQYLLSKSKVFIVGLGGLGSPAAIYLTLAGVGKLGLIDYDRVELSNLQRQPLYKESDIGKYKVEAAKENLLQYNKDLKIEAFQDIFTYDKKDLLKEYDLILDCSDTLVTRREINRVSLEMRIPFLYCSIDQYSFQISLLNYNDGPCFECLYPDLENSQLLNCVERGILGPVAGIAGLYQAMEGIKFLVNLNPLREEILYFDVVEHKSLKFKVHKNTDCFCKNYHKKEKQSINGKDIKIPSITSTQLKSLENFVLIDLREDSEHQRFSQDLIFKDTNFYSLKKISLKELPYKIEEIPKHTTIVVMCDSGIRAKQGARVLKEMDFSNVFYLEHDLFYQPLI